MNLFNLFVFLLLITNTIVNCQEIKTDTIILKTGEKLVGKIEGKGRGIKNPEIQIQTLNSETVFVNYLDISSMTTTLNNIKFREKELPKKEKSVNDTLWNYKSKYIKRIDAFTIRPLSLFFNEVSIYYDRGLNKKFPTVYSLGFIYPGDRINFGSVVYPVFFTDNSREENSSFLLNKAWGASLRAGKKYVINYTPKTSLYSAIVVNLKFRYYNNLNTKFTPSPINISGNITGLSLQLCPQLLFGFQTYLGNVFMDFFVGGGFYTRRDYFNYTNLQGGQFPIEPNKSSGILETDEAFKFYPSLHIGTKIGLRRLVFFK